MKLLFKNRDNDINADSDPHLGFYCVRRCSKELFDAQMLLDPFEEQFDFPAGFVNLANDQGGEGEVIGQKDKIPVGLCIVKSNTPELVRIVL